MPSTSKKQAKLMSAIDHGWHPAHPNHKLPSRAVAHEFHEADKAEGKYMHAEGGQIESALEQFTGSPAHMGRSMVHTPNIGYMTHMKMPYVPVAGVTRNVFAHLKGAQEKLPKLQQKMSMPKYHYKYDQGGAVGSDPRAAIEAAMTHLANRDASSAAAALMSNPVVMQHPGVAQIAQALRTGQNIGAASRALATLAGGSQASQGGEQAVRSGGRIDPRRGRR